MNLIKVQKIFKIEMLYFFWLKCESKKNPVTSSCNILLTFFSLEKLGYKKMRIEKRNCNKTCVKPR